MTKEKILIKKYGCKDLDDLKKCFLNNIESLSMILEAMEEFDQHQAQERYDKAKNHLEKYYFNHEISQAHWDTLKIASGINQIKK